MGRIEREGEDRGGRERTEEGESGGGRGKMISVPPLNPLNIDSNNYTI